MTHINQREDLAANWAFENPVLQAGEIGWVRDADPPTCKKGDGVTAWLDLPYSIPQPGVTSVNGRTGDITLTKADVGLNRTNNTPDMEKPISVPQQAALDLKAPLASPAFTGNPTAPTPAAADNDTSIATTAFVNTAVTAIRTLLGGGIYATAAQTIPNNVGTQLIYGDDLFDNGSLVDLPGNRLVIPAGGAGLYFVHSQVSFAAGTTGTRTLSLRVNGDETYVGRINASSGGGTYGVVASGFLPLAVGDAITSVVTQNQGANLDTLGDRVHRTMMSAVRVSL